MFDEKRLDGSGRMVRDLNAAAAEALEVWAAGPLDGDMGLENTCRVERFLQNVGCESRPWPVAGEGSVGLRVWSVVRAGAAYDEEAEAVGVAGVFLMRWQGVGAGFVTGFDLARLALLDERESACRRRRLA